MLGNELLEGRLIRLAPPSLDDLIVLSPYQTFDYHRQVSLRLAYPQAPETIWAWIREGRQQRTAYYFTIRRKADEYVLGTVSIKNIIWSARRGELGIGIPDPTQRGQGYGRDAIETLLRYAFMELNLHRVELMTSSYNEKAAALYRGIGFVDEGAEREAIQRDRQYYDILYFGLLRREWLARYGEEGWR